MIKTFSELRALALTLNLPHVEDSTSWGNPCLKAHGKLWTWWSPYVDAALFKCDFDEREMLLQADPDTFLLHPHYKAHKLILVRGGRIDPDWAKARLRRQWCDMAPKRVLKAWNAANSQI